MPTAETDFWTHLASAVGVCTGITGMIVSIAAYRRAGRTKATEMLLELQRAHVTVGAQLDALPDLIETALQSRLRVNSPLGQSRSGGEQLFVERTYADSQRAKDLNAKVSVFVPESAKIDINQLRLRLVLIHSLQLEVDGLTVKYRASLAEDDVRRAEIRQQHLHLGV